MTNIWRGSSECIVLPAKNTFHVILGQPTGAIERNRSSLEAFCTVEREPRGDFKTNHYYSNEGGLSAPFFIACNRNLKKNCLISTSYSNLEHFNSYKRVTDFVNCSLWVTRFPLKQISYYFYKSRKIKKFLCKNWSNLSWIRSVNISRVIISEIINTLEN